MKAKNIDFLLAERGLTCAEIVARSGLSNKTLYSARQGAEIRPKTAGKIAKALDVPITEIIKD